MYTAVRSSSPITIDGILDEKSWDGPFEKGFIQREPYENKNPSQDTEFRIVYDDEYLYAAIKSLDSSPDSIVRRLSRRDKLDGDMVGLMIDSYHDLRTSFNFLVSASGVKSDEIVTNDGSTEDFTWDPIWQVKTSINDRGWYAEIKIPLTQLRFEKGNGKVWGLNVVRLLFRKNEVTMWQLVTRTDPGFVHLFGEMAFSGELKPKKQLDLTPYVTASTRSYQEEEGNPFSSGRENRLNGGIDGKIGLTNNMILDFTVNPDFGQVEADPSVVNLTAYETFYTEKRPFFIEGSNITKFSVGFGDGDLSTEQLFYSRRVGRRPQFNPDLRDNEYISRTGFTPILGAAKLTGKTADGWSVGILESLTGKVNAKINYQGITRTQPVEPLTNYFVGRIQKDSKSGNTILGVMATSTDRDLDDDLLRAAQHKNGRTAAFDFKQYFGHKNYQFVFNSIVSQVNGSKEAIASTQTSSAHYFQRPDARHLHYNENLTRLEGNGGNLQFWKTGGNLNGLCAVMWKSPGLEINDVGYLRSTDEIIQVTWLGYKFTKPKWIVRSANINMNQWNAWDFFGNHLVTGGDISGFIRFNNQCMLRVGGHSETESLSSSQLRGGPAMRVPGVNSLFYYGETDLRKKFSLSLEGQHARQGENASSSSFVTPGIRWQPTNYFEFHLLPSFSSSEDKLQYVTNQSWSGGDRYILGSVNQKSVSMSVRVNVNLRPNLTIQYWGQPFIASGKYSHYKMVTNPRAEKFLSRFKEYEAGQLTMTGSGDDILVDENLDGRTDYRFSDPNFNFNEFLSNFVVRWEYVPGSTLYLVWSQHRMFENSIGEFDYTNNLNRLYNNEKPDNTLMIKLSYRIAVH